MNNSLKKVLVIYGPTAAGKTCAAIQSALKLNGEIVNADSVQIYKYMNIGSAKPTKSELETVKHHMIDIVTPDIGYSAGMYKNDASEIIENIETRKKLPIITGGTALYIRSLIDGLFEGPSANPTLREQFENLEKSTPGILFKMLSEKDSQTAKRLHPNDKLRIIRALEVFELTGKPISYFHKNQQNPFRNALFLVIDPGKIELEKRIVLRVQKMLKEGFVDEVQKLFDMGYTANLRPLQSVGYKQVIDYLNGIINYKDLPKLIVRSHLQYARKQRKWFKTRGIHIEKYEDIPFEKILNFLDLL